VHGEKHTRQRQCRRNHHNDVVLHRIHRLVKQCEISCDARPWRLRGHFPHDKTGTIAQAGFTKTHEDEVFHHVKAANPPPGKQV
jgi:hypothetical protein